MHSREDSDRLSWALSALVVVIMGVAVGVSSRETSSANDSDPRTRTAVERPQHPETQAESRSGTTGTLKSPSAERPALL